MKKLYNYDPLEIYETHAGENITKYFPIALDKVTTGPPVLKFKSLTKINFRTGFNYEDNEPEKENIEDVSDLNIVNNGDESIIDNNNLLNTQKRELTDEEIKKLSENLLKNNISGMEDEDKKGEIMRRNIDIVNHFLNTNIIDEDDNVNDFDEDEITKRNT
jgi:hypothetical protein